MHARVPFRADVSICWLAGTEIAEIYGKGVDLSGYGMLVEARTSIPTNIQLSVARLPIPGTQLWPELIGAEVAR